ncbi:peptide-methionine (S)-S-oxide reductase MsrA [Jeotgalibaca sp. MA1X17-3]|uniref:peptide-methionine (S)-S-oxide reductase MsrA n=1 Tax=Jeotgalibaca sp. MA1X17-3 TaxID=2908211 RepID=UPI001F33D59C|nr:peptide-methionine (S)-S-oxide reductase MsrA [Jeotgalibaca sp. MA1X17-3]UJF16103.1 peptide-methionine (S)-S-oxide reductase MsrA [Jeotgalibaca sp. MA1X17-3]
MNSFNLQASSTEKIILGMGCFWGPDSSFGSLPGVISTVVGYAGGTSSHPTYRKIDDYTETVEITFDPQLLSLESLLHTFWQTHDATKNRFYRERQYISLIVFQNIQQKKIAENIKQIEEKRQGKEIQTEFQVATPFYPAEDYHQKYFLRRFKEATKNVQKLFPDEETFIRSTISARLNGFIRENKSLPEIKEEIKNWDLSEEHLKELQNMILSLKW